MQPLDNKLLLDAGVHFGHLRKKWNPKMRPYIYMERKGLHIIDLNKTNAKLQEAASAMQNIARSGKKILYVATKKQAKEIIQNSARKVKMPFVTERWLGGMLTNFATIKKSIRKMQSIDRGLADGTYNNITKKERLVLARERDKLERVLGGIADLSRIPAAIFLVDIGHEHIALAESKKLRMTTFGMVDTNSDPNLVDFAIPANDDASKSIELITNYVTSAIEIGLNERKKEREANAKAKEDRAKEDKAKQAQAEEKKAEATTAPPPESKA